MDVISKVINMSKFSTSKKILFVSYAIALLCLGIFIYTLLTQNPYCGEMGAIFVASLAEVSVHTACYSSKSKKENALKIAYDMVDKLADKYGIDSVATIFDSVNRD